MAHKFLKDATGAPRLFVARDGKIDLASIPFVRMSPFLVPEALQEPPDYARIVEDLDAALRALAPVRVRVEVERRGFWVGEQKIDLPHRSFALYALLAEARKRSWAPSAATKLGEEHFGWLTIGDLVDPGGLYLSRYCEILSACHTSAVDIAEDFTAKLRREIALDKLSVEDGFRTT